jgi:predicted RNA-binding protein with PUA-like domain
MQTSESVQQVPQVEAPVELTPVKAQSAPVPKKLLKKRNRVGKTPMEKINWT